MDRRLVAPLSTVALARRVEGCGRGGGSCHASSDENGNTVLRHPESVPEEP